MKRHKIKMTLPDGSVAIKIEKYQHYYVTESGEIWSEHSQKYLSQKVYGKYKVVRLYSNGHVTTINVHSLVANAFVPNDNPTVTNTINHIDEDKTNNHASNLEWVTHGENLAHSGVAERAASAVRKPVYQYTKKGEYVGEYDSRASAAKALGVRGASVSYAMDNPNRFCRGYKLLSTPL